MTTTRKPLTDDELRDALRSCPHDAVENLRVRWLYAKDFARAIERAHGITEGGQAGDTDERARFEAVWPTPENCTWTGVGYSPTGYSAWSAHTHAARWEGWQARAALDEKPLFSDNTVHIGSRSNTPTHEPSEAEQVCAEAYQVVGSLLHDLGQFDTEHARKVLDNLSAARRVHDDVLPWPSFERQVAALSEPQPEHVKAMRLALKPLATIVELIESGDEPGKGSLWHLEARAAMAALRKALGEQA